MKKAAYAALVLAMVIAACAPACAHASAVPDWLADDQDALNRLPVAGADATPQTAVTPPPAAPQPTAMPASLAPLAATLNQRMATRTGPGTQYTEDHGTQPTTTTIVLYQQEMGSGVPWGMVEFTYNGALVRAYTGMKRIDTAAAVPWGYSDPLRSTSTVAGVQSHFGPGAHYMPARLLPAGTAVDVWGEDLGYLLVEFQANATQRMRVWIPADTVY